MSFTPSTDLVLSEPSPKRSVFNAKRAMQMAGAAVLSFGLVGTFSLPAYAVAPEVEGAPMGYKPAQILQTVESVDAPLAVTDLNAEVGANVLEEERLAAEAERQAEAAAEAAAAAEATATTGASAAFTGKDVPAGVGAQGIVNAALAQIGQSQDCTALVERSLRAVGIPAGDLGTQTHEYLGLGGTLVTNGDYAPGDVLIWHNSAPGVWDGHVAVYIGNGQAVHGGWSGFTTVVADAFAGKGTPQGVVRFG